MSPSAALRLTDSIFVINLASDTEKLQQIQTRFEKAGLDFFRYDAVRGTAGLGADGTAVHPVCKAVTCTDGVIGCARSHIDLWKRLAEDPARRAYVIMEDDGIFDDTLRRALDVVDDRWLSQSPRPFNYFNLACIGPFCGGKRAGELMPGYGLYTSVFPLGMAAYVITKEAAASLLQRLLPLQYHIDFEVASAAVYGHKDLDVVSVYPPIVNPHRNNSNIAAQHRRSLLLGWSDDAMWYANQPATKYSCSYSCLLTFVALFGIIVGGPVGTTIAIVCLLELTLFVTS